MKSNAVMDSAKTFGDNVMKTGRNLWLVGLGAVAYAEEEGRSAYDRLVAKGQDFEKSDHNYLGRAFDRASSSAKDLGRKVESTVQDAMTSVLHRAGVPTREEIRTLIDRVEKLTAKVEARG